MSLISQQSWEALAGAQNLQRKKHPHTLLASKIITARLLLTAQLNKILLEGTSLAVQWLKLCASNAGGVGLILFRGNQDPTCPRGTAKTKRFYWTENGSTGE